MKKAFIFFLVPVFIQACSGGSSSTMPSSKDSSAPAANITMPYTASYSSSFTPGTDSNTLVVLNSYKAWEKGDMPGLKATMSDSLTFNFSSGYSFKGKLDSFMVMAGKYRDSLSSVNINMQAWLPVHSTDKNEDWVLVWYIETDKYKSGKVDSMAYQDDNLVKDGKIIYTDSHVQKLK